MPATTPLRSRQPVPGCGARGGGSGARGGGSGPRRAAGPRAVPRGARRPEGARRARPAAARSLRGGCSARAAGKGPDLYLLVIPAATPSISPRGPPFLRTSVPGTPAASSFLSAAAGCGPTGGPPTGRRGGPGAGRPQPPPPPLPEAG